MTLDTFLADFTWTTLLAVAISAYAASVAVYLVLQNRSPQSTFAWLFLLLIFPIGGLVIYVMFGRSWHAFSRRGELTRLIESSSLAERVAEVLAVQPTRIEALADGPYKDYAGLGSMLWITDRAPLTLSNELEILQDAREKYPRLMEDMRNASDSIHLLYYEWASDHFTEEVSALLAEKVRQGIEVRILYDPVGSFFMLSRSHVQRLRSAGVQMYPFSPVYHVHTLSYRNHRKIAVIDGRIGYSGGLNMTEKHLTGPEGFTGWRDTHARVAGEAAEILQLVFATVWDNTTGENIIQERYFPEVQAGLPTIPIQVVSGGPDSEWQAIRQSYLAMISLARRHIYLQSPFLIPDTSLAEAMKAAAMSGLDVQLMVAPAGAEWSPAYRAGMTYANDMARAGVKVLLYQGAYFHAKTVCVDSVLCAIGSANIDIRSFAINYETNLVIYDAAVTRELEADFREDCRHTIPFSVAAYESSPVTSRLVDSTLRLCSPLL